MVHPLTTIKEQVYKNRTITKVEDAIGQELVFIDNDFSKPFASIADAKRIINGKQPIYQVI